jgi:hypothetical protein
MMDGDGTAMGRGRENGDVCHFADAGGMVTVELNDDLLRVAKEGGGGSDGAGKIDAPILGDLGGLDNSEVNLPEESLGDCLRQVREVHVDKLNLPGIQLLAESLA